MRRVLFNWPSFILLGGAGALAVAFWISLAFGSTPENTVHVYWAATWSPASDLGVNIVIDGALLFLTLCVGVGIGLIGLLLLVFAIVLLVIGGVASISPVASWFVGVSMIVGLVVLLFLAIRGLRRRRRRHKK